MRERERKRYQTTCKRRQESRSKSNRALERFSEISYSTRQWVTVLLCENRWKRSEYFLTLRANERKNRNNVNETLSIKKKYMYTYWLLETTLMRLWVSIINFNFHQSSLNEEQSLVWRFVYGVFWCRKPQSPNPHGIWNKIKELREKERAATTVCGGASEFCCHWCWRRLWVSCLWIELWLWRIAREREF